MGKTNDIRAAVTDDLTFDLGQGEPLLHGAIVGAWRVNVHHQDPVTVGLTV
jgi:hypothetical protein